MFVKPFTGDRGRVRTCNHQSRNLIFYPIELQGHYFFNNAFKYSLPIPDFRYFSRKTASIIVSNFSK